MKKTLCILILLTAGMALAQINLPAEDLGHGPLTIRKFGQQRQQRPVPDKLTGTSIQGVRVGHRNAPSMSAFGIFTGSTTTSTIAMISTARSLPRA